jgi:hypothetical protein
MNRRSVLLFALAVALLSAGRASASPIPAGAADLSILALPVTPGVVAPDFALTTSPAAGAPARFAAWDGTRLGSIGYRPRRQRGRGYDLGGRSHGFGEITGGFFDPEGELSSGVLFGFRIGSTLDDRVQIGLGFDWNHRSDRQSAVVREVPLPGGGTARRTLELSRSSSDLFPILASLQVSPGTDLPVSPYFGVGAGYEVLFISADDFATGDQFDATYGNWGWQAWAGAAVPLSHWSRLKAEVFFNSAEVSRDVDDPSGATFQETVDMDGVGMRVGLSWAF